MDSEKPDRTSEAKAPPRAWIKLPAWLDRVPDELFLLWWLTALSLPWIAGLVAYRLLT